MYEQEKEILLKEPQKPFQKEASYFMFNKKKCFNLDEMGLGKTVETLGALKLLSDAETLKALIVVVGSTINQWSEEISRFTNFNVIKVSGNASTRTSQYNLFKYMYEDTILLISYNSILVDSEVLEGLEFNVAVFDEATTLKNPLGELHKHYKYLVRDVPNIYLLTGAPITTNLADFYWMFQILNIKGYLGSFDEEVGNSLVISDSSYKHSKVIGAKDFESFRDKLEPFYIRRTFKSVFKDSLNVKMDFNVEFLEQTQVQLAHLKRLALKANQASKGSMYNPLRYAANKAKLACSPYVLDSSFEKDSPKIDYLLSLVRNSAEGSKFVVYIKYLDFVDLVESRLKDSEIGFCEISGRMSKEEQDLRKKQFVQNPNYRVLILTGAGKMGLNLQVASTFVFLDVPFNPADLLQYIGRVYRLGQSKDVQVKLLVMAKSIEEKRFRDLVERHKVLDEFFNVDFTKLYRETV